MEYLTQYTDGTIFILTETSMFIRFAETDLLNPKGVCQYRLSIKTILNVALTNLNVTVLILPVSNKFIKLSITRL